MKRWFNGLMAVILTASMLFVGGCDLKPNQIKVIAQNTGLAAAVTWIAYDNPSPAEVDLVNGILVVIRGKSGDIQADQTYTQVIFPEVEKYLEKAIANGTIPANYKPLVLAGSLSMLNGIDLLFATNPEWQEDEALALQVVDSFILGATQGLSLAEDDPRIEAAREAAARRARVFTPATE